MPTWQRLAARDVDVLCLQAAEDRGRIGMLRHGPALTAALTARLGGDVTAWQVAAELLDDWDGTVGEALDAAAAHARR